MFMAGVMSGKKMFCLIFLCIVIIGSFIFETIVIKGDRLKDVSQKIIQTKAEVADIELIKGRISSLKTPQDLLDLENSLDHIAIENESNFLLLEEMVVKKIVGLVNVGDYTQMGAFTANCDFISTNNLLVMAFFEQGKLSNSKSDLIFGSVITYCRCLINDCSRFEEVQELFLDRILKSPDKFSAIELEYIFSGISLSKEKELQFLNRYTSLKEMN